ncbi:MAG: M14 family metallopeptidase [Candidatus Sedimenticola sp. 20ELBAFRAG]
MKSHRHASSGSRFRKILCTSKMIIIILLSSVLAAIMPVSAEKNVASYFSNTYQEARDKFLSAVKVAGGHLEHYPNPYRGAEDEALYIDVATFNLAEAKTILVLGSGTHGVEGFAGSGIQVGLLREGIAKDIPDNVGLLFYHALNPYGFSHLRRYNEDNVDLNRNFVNHRKPYPSNTPYDELAWLVEPDSLSAWGNLKAKAGAAWYRITKGAWWLQSAISRGQYNHPKGLFFGGNKETWSNNTLQKIIQHHLSKASRVILIDIHTGLGKYGAAEVINEILPGTSRYEWMMKCWEIRITNPHVGDAVSPTIIGPLKRGFERLLPNAEVIAVSLEFGTYPPSKVLWALRAENYLHHKSGWDHPNASEIKGELKRMFYPQEEDWMRMVWDKGSIMVLNTLDCLR